MTNNEPSKSFLELIVVVPVAHLLSTGLFLMGYYAAFGRRLFAFSDSSDIFTASIGDIGFNYITTMTIPIIMIAALRGQSGHWSFADAALAVADEPAREAAINKFRSDRKFMILLLLLTSIIQAALATFCYFKWGYIPYSFVSFFATLAMIIFVTWFSSKTNVTSFMIHILILITLVFSASFFNGLSRGQLDRKIEYRNFMSGAIKCGSGLVIRPVGSHLLLLNSDGSYTISDNECKSIATIQKL